MNGDFAVYIQRAATWLTSTGAVPLYAVMLAWGGVEMKIHRSISPLGWSMAGAAVTFGSAWGARYFYA